MISPKLRTLLAVAECQNFTKAAAELSLTQPAVSHHISQLEEELGVTLFIRGKGGLKLTAEGEIVVKYARRMAALYDRILADLADRERKIRTLRVGITHTAESNITAEALAKCSGKDDGFSITIITDTINNLYNMLGNYELDLAIVEGNSNDPAFSSLVLDTDYLVCVMAPDHPLAKNAMITLQQLRRERMILRLPTSATRVLFDSTLRSLDDSPENYNIVMEVDNIATIKELIRKDLGVSVLAKSACADELRKKKLVALPIENLTMARETRIVYNKDFTSHDILQTILRVYQETLRENR